MTAPTCGFFTTQSPPPTLPRLPTRLLDLETAERYCVGEPASVWARADHLVLDLGSEADEESWEEDAERSLASIVGIRTEPAAGDLRGLYLAWQEARKEVSAMIDTKKPGEYDAAVVLLKEDLQALAAREGSGAEFGKRFLELRGHQPQT